MFGHLRLSNALLNGGGRMWTGRAARRANTCTTCLYAVDARPWLPTFIRVYHRHVSYPSLLPLLSGAV